MKRQRGRGNRWNIGSQREINIQVVIHYLRWKILPFTGLSLSHSPTTCPVAFLIHPPPVLPLPLITCPASLIHSLTHPPTTCPAYATHTSPTCPLSLTHLPVLSNTPTHTSHPPTPHVSFTHALCLSGSTLAWSALPCPAYLLVWIASQPDRHRPLRRPHPTQPPVCSPTTWSPLSPLPLSP